MLGIEPRSVSRRDSGTVALKSSASRGVDERRRERSPVPRGWGSKGVVRQVLLEEHADVIREAVKAAFAELMELEVTELIEPERGERRSDDRATRRNRDRARPGDTRAGEIVLQIPRDPPRQRFPEHLGVEPALLGVIQHA
jgi:hypothetical protein